MQRQYIEPVLRPWFDPLTRTLQLPSLCAVCHGWGSQRICAACVARFAPAQPRCRRCALEVPAGVEVCGACLSDPPPYAAALAAVDYGHPWDRLIAAFKFHSALDLTASLAQLLLQAQRVSGEPLPELLLPVPLSDSRLRERGYNQAWQLARHIAGALGCRSEPQLLLRLRDTPHQLALPPDRRAANVRAAFALEPQRAAELRGREVAVVDDVMTTGATAAEITRVLLQAGAARVQIWVVARTPRPAA